MPNIASTPKVASYALDKSTGRVVRRRASSGCVLALDTSGSMSIVDGIGDRRRIDVLAQVLADVMAQVRLQALITFDSFVEELPLSGAISLPEPSGGTQVGEALAWCLDQEVTPRRVTVISDGGPTDPVVALANAERCRARGIVIDAYFVGDRNDHAAQAFMQRLAGSGAPGGRWGQFRLGGEDAKRLGSEVVLAITDQRGEG